MVRFKELLHSTFRILLSRKGFTLFELVVFSALFAIAAVSFVSILVSVTKIQVRQGAAAEVNQQSLFLLQTLQRYVEQSSVVDLPADTATSTLKLRMSASSTDPAYIYLSGDAVYLKETDNGTAQSLTSDKVKVTSLRFVKRANPPAKDSVSIIFSMEYNDPNPQNKFAQSLNTSIARVSAATFDSDIVPPSGQGNTYKLGTSAQDWKSINNTIFFNGSNVGIGQSVPSQALEVDGALRLNTTSNKPACNSSVRGTIWFTQGGSGKDALEVCAQDALGGYAWRSLY